MQKNGILVINNKHAGNLLISRTTIPAARQLWLVRLWLGVTWFCAGPIRLAARLLHRRMGAEPHRFDERLGMASIGVGGRVIWIHAASLGEVAQTEPIVRYFIQNGSLVLITTTTKAGADWVAKELPSVIHQYAPIDTAQSVRRFLAAWNIHAAIFIEGDFSPRLTLETQARDIPMALLNARHSRTRARFPTVFGALLRGFALVTCRSDAVARDIRTMGLANTRVHVVPDLRIGATRKSVAADLVDHMRTHIGARPVWVAASTHQGDEAVVLSAHRTVLQKLPNALLILVPRHPKRGAPLEDASQALALVTLRRSSGGTISTSTQVYIADTLGELDAYLQLAPVAFMGGSFGDEGGHNPYEPACHGAAILSGPNIRNFIEAYDALSDAGAAELVQDPAALGHRLVDLMQSDTAQTMGAAGARFIANSVNSMPRTIALLKDALEI